MGSLQGPDWPPPAYSTWALGGGAAAGVEPSIPFDSAAAAAIPDSSSPAPSARLRSRRQLLPSRVANNFFT